jgi:hypothetical protein
MIFEKPGPSNTDQALAAAFQRGKQLGLDEVVVSSSSGKTAYKALDVFDGFRLTVVTYHCGFREPFKPVMADGVKRDLEKKGATVVSATHALSGVERSIAKKHQGLYPALLIADTLRLFGQGTKVAVEISIMAADAGTLSGKDIVAVGGTAKGVDTALIIRPAGQSDIFTDLCIREIICKPRTWG